ncbi:hypothetical protein QTP86_008341 [Hemibagrus guttatus]|nr:hypothetical protein QTP86_008341 [Hemibagrus guttatus]
MEMAIADVRFFIEQFIVHITVDIRPDEDLVLDILLYLWAKCKLIFQRAQARLNDLVCYMAKMAFPDKWVQTLFLLCEVAYMCQLADIDTVAVAEMTLRLASVLEGGVDVPSLTIPMKDSVNGSSLRSTPVEKSTATPSIMFSGEHLRSSGHGQFESAGSSCTRSLSMDMHMELLAFQHRISLKLLDIYSDDENPEGRKRLVTQSAQGQSTAVQSKRAKAECALQEKIKKNKVSRVLFLVQKALLSYKKDASNRGTKKLLEEALALLEKACVEEKRLFSDATSAEIGSGGEEGCRPPLPPVLLSRSNQALTFTPAPYVLEEQIPSRGEHLFCISGLEPNQKYIFAVAAYDAQGNLIGGSIGDTTRPVLASLPLPLLTAWAHLAQVAYQTGQYALAKKACSEIWSHFTLPSVAESGACQDVVDEKAPERLAQTKLCPETLQLSSPTLQQLFLTSIFMQTDIHIQERALYCDSLSDGSPLIWGQEDRLAECDRMLVAIDLSLHLNNISAALQAVVSCYGLLAPLIFYQIPSDPVIQVLLKCLMVLQEIPVALKQKRPVATTESLYHMVACITHYVAKGLQALKEECMASSVMEQGKQLLMEMTASLQQNDRKPQKKAVVEQEDEPSEELKALTCIALKQQEKMGALNGNRVMKFKRMSGFMEFVALVLEKALREDQLELLIQWGQEIFSRDESLMLPKKDDMKSRKDQKKFTISIIQYCNKINKVYKKKNELQKKSVSCSENSENYSKLSLRFLSLAHTGTLVKWKNISQHIKPPELSPSILKPTIHKASQGAPNNSGEGSEESEVESELDTPRTQLTSGSESSETTETRRIMFKPLDTIYKASLHLRRAMVLAYRGRLWTSLQWVSEILWDQFSNIAFLVECSQSSENPSTLTLEQFYTVFTPLLALASELLMDMMEKLQQWKVYDEEAEEPETRPLNSGVRVDLNWMKNLVLHTLELLFYQTKWETLAHLALLYNFYTREQYTHIIIPVLVYAQRRLLERISYFGGPSVPQPHFTYTEMVTGEKVTCRNYAGKQLLLCPSVESWHESTASNTASEPLELAERRRAMCVVSVPLDIDDTLRCFRESQAKRRHTLRIFQHSRTLLMLLLANTQHSIEVPFCQESFHGSQGKVEFNIAANTAPSIGPPDLSNEDYNSAGSVYSTPLSPLHIQTILSSYNSSIKYLQANNYTSLQVQALHDLGNLHFYNGNLKAAHTHWSKALDCSLQATNVLESWDGDSWSHNSSQHPLRHAGIWGCLQGAVLSAKIAQYVLTSNIRQRTNCCLLSAKLFKVKMLTELHLFAEAVKEIHSLSDGEEIPLPHSSFTKAVKVSTRKKFSNYQPLTNPCNLEVLEELVNKRLSEDIAALYGTKLTCQLHLARLQLILAMCSTIYELPEPFSDLLEAQVRSSSSSSLHNSASDNSPSSPSMKSTEPKGLQLHFQKDILTPGQVKALLQKEIFNQLNSELFALQHIHTDPEELELAVEIKLLLSNLTLQQGKAALSADQAASALRLLQDSPLLQSDRIEQPPPRRPSSVLKQSSNRAEHEQLYEPEADTGPQLGDMSATVEALECMGRSLWLRCTLAVVQSLTAHIPGTVIYPVQCLVHLNLYCGLSVDDPWYVSSCAQKKEAVSLLSGCNTLSLQSSLSLAKATLLLSELRGSDGQPLYLLTQKLLQKQLKALGECVMKKAGEGLEVLSTAAWRNIYHPQLPLLARTTMRLGQCLALQAMVSSSEEDEQHLNLWSLAQEELHSAFIISQGSASRDPQLEADILYLKGIVGRILMSLGTLKHQTVVETFLESITLAHSHSHSLQLIYRCYMEMALIYLQQWQNTTTELAEPPPPPETTESGKTMEVLTNHGQLCSITTATEGPLPLRSLKALADFVSNDLLSPCGRMQESMLVHHSSDPDIDTGLKIKRCSEITWEHLSRYYTHLLNLRHISRQPMAGRSVEEFISPAGDSNLTLRLTQLHTFFSDHLPTYKEQCVIPDPPSALILEPQTIQIMLIFALNKAPMSDTQPNMLASAHIEAGHRLISTDSMTSCIQEPEDGNRSPVKTGTSTPQQMLLEKTRHICTEIRNLLKPDLKTNPITKVPFEPSVQLFCDLEHCFNPTSGATLEDRALIDWLFSLLT